MSIAADSRYAFGDFITVQVTDTKFNIAVFAGSIVIDNVPISYYVAKVGDRFDKLAQRFFSDPTKWWVIADLNPEVRWPGDIPANTVIRIPVFTDTLGINSALDTTAGNFLSQGVTRG